MKFDLEKARKLEQKLIENCFSSLSRLLLEKGWNVLKYGGKKQALKTKWEGLTWRWLSDQVMGGWLLKEGETVGCTPHGF